MAAVERADPPGAGASGSEGRGIDFAKGGGLVPVVVQDDASGDVLMLAYMDEVAFRATLATGFMHYHSRSRARTWKKGEESGHVQELVSLRLDCDGDTLLATVKQSGPACHAGTRTCFVDTVAGEGAPILEDLDRVLDARLAAPGGESYTGKLFADENKRLKKIGEEAVEVVVAARGHDKAGLPGEVADLLYHALVVAKAEGVSYRDVLRVLAERRRK